MNNSWLNSLLDRGLAFYTASQGGGANQGPARTTVQQPVEAQSNWLPFAIIGGVAVVIVGLVLAFRR